MADEPQTTNTSTDDKSSVAGGELSKPVESIGTPASNNPASNPATANDSTLNISNSTASETKIDEASLKEIESELKKVQTGLKPADNNPVKPTVTNNITPLSTSDSSLADPLAKSSEKPIAAAPITKPNPPSTPPPNPTTSPGKGATPLAFAGGLGAKVSPSTPPPTASSPMPAKISTPPPAPPPQSPEPDKPKKKGGKVVGMILGLFLLVGGIAAGYYYFNVQTPEVAQVGQQLSCNQDVNGGCGAEPQPLPSFNKTATVNFNENGKMVIYKRGGSGLIAHVTYNGQSHNVDLTTRRNVTNIDVTSGTSATLTGVTEPNQGDPGCAPTNNNPKYKGTGWIDINANNSCGSGLAGPPTGGQCTAFGKPDMSSFIAWAESHNDTILDKECWADWREWPGDYDFNDYFIMLAVEPEAVVPTVACTDISNNNQNPGYGDDVIFTCNGAVSDSSAIDYEFRYSIDGSAYTTASSTGNTATINIDTAGTWVVECRACASINGSQVCEPVWQGAN